MPADHKTFCINVDVIEYCGGVISKDTGAGLVDGELTSTGLTCANAAPGQLQDAEDAVPEWVLACTFLWGSNRSQYGKLLEDLLKTTTLREPITTRRRSSRPTLSLYIGSRTPGI